MLKSNMAYGSASLYDEIYSFKDYGLEASKLQAIIQTHHPKATSLLDVACGTGKHLQYLKQYQCDGIDLSPELLLGAKELNPEMRFYQGDMRFFELGKTYDIVTCLFSAIGYMKTIDELNQAIGAMAKHLAPQGLLIIEPWFTPETWHPGHLHSTHVDRPDLKITRMNISETRNGLAYMEMHYLVGQPTGINHFMEVHEMGLFSHESYLRAIDLAGLSLVEYLPDGLIGRGLYIGRQSGPTE